MAARRAEAVATVSGRLIKDSACPLARPFEFDDKPVATGRPRVTPRGHFDRNGVVDARVDRERKNAKIRPRND